MDFWSTTKRGWTVLGSFEGGNLILQKRKGFTKRMSIGVWWFLFYASAINRINIMVVNYYLQSDNWCYLVTAINILLCILHYNRYCTVPHKYTIIYNCSIQIKCLHTYNRLHLAIYMLALHSQNLSLLKMLNFTPTSPFPLFICVSTRVSVSIFHLSYETLKRR